MNCINCGAYLPNAGLEYCPRCGCNVMIQKKLDYLSKLYYNQGLEKASIRDLSGAISCLRQSLSYNKANIRARNLLGLVYFETGEVVAALGEWVISENLMPNNNLASEYINKLRANSNKLEAINETIRKYNHALIMCRQGHEDMAAIQLRKILSQNSKLIKGYHLLALIQMKNHEWSKARRTLKKAARIDKTNTTTLRFLREVDEQTGVATRLEKQNKGFFRNEEEEGPDREMVVNPVTYKEQSRFPIFFTLLIGIAVGALGLWLLVVPSIRQGIYREANEQIVRYSESLASRDGETQKAESEAKQSDNTLQEQAEQLQEEQARRVCYEAMLSAYIAVQKNEMESAVVELQKINPELLTDDMKSTYETLNKDVNEYILKKQGEAAAQSNAGNSGENDDSDAYDSYGGYDNSYGSYSSYDSYDSYGSYNDYY